MGVLASCWFIIESFLIPDGLFLKWFYLRFYIHPFFLFVCQIFLWLKVLLKWVLVVFFYPLKIVRFVGLYVFKFFKNCVTCVLSSTRLTNFENFNDVENLSLVPNCNNNQIVALCSVSSTIAPLSCQLKASQLRKYYVLEEDNNYKDDQVSCEHDNMDEESSCLSLNEDKSMVDDDLSSICCSSESCSLDLYKAESFVHSDANSSEHVSSVFISNSPIAYLDMNEYSSSVLGSNSEPKDQDMNECSTSINHFYSLAPIKGEEPNGCAYQDLDAFYSNYIERMRWFDVLNYDRTCGISVILDKQLGTPSSFESTEPVDFSVLPCISRSKRAKNRLLRSLESDFELVYVAQSCLSWEALHHQYRKVEALASSSSQNGVFYDNMAGEFQKFQVLLERFMEDERCQGKRVWNYVGGRFSLKSLLQVPKVSGFSENKMEEMKAEATNIKEVLKAIESCIQAFWIFVKIDNKKPWWKLTSALWTCPPVEDPRDLKLLADLTKKLQKKELWLKDSQGKQRCWFKRVVDPIEESQRKELLFTMIDIKLISRVLQLSMLSSPQLKWCEEKLDKIEFKEGKIVRASTSGPLFPP